ncbi:MAG: hypothetical protein UU09_C0035G0010 [Microgenomates group bacterium GW2011_GWA2_40_6]|nr:MAG: hypothetical protein UU09_C0035G0010 [Microgenomates group bacterium GW2011_GWA2_40_6]
MTLFLADFKFISFWWLFILGFSVLLLPLTFALFHRFFDRGYIFAKILSLTLITYIIFCFSVIRLLPFTQFSILIILLLILFADLFYFFKLKNWSSFKKIFLVSFKFILFEEILFLTVLALWSYVRGHTPDIDGLEKYMDWGFVNSALRTHFLPPADMWYAGSPINYYYFGHLVFALLTKVSGLPSAITYNLSIATVCALTFVSTFSLSANLVFHYLKSNIHHLKSIILAGLLSALLLTFGGNLHPLYKIIKTDIQNNGYLDLSIKAIKLAASTYWYPDATRFIGFDPDVSNKTIHEFPLYSFVVSDLHGHMNDIPLILCFLAFLFSYSLSIKNFGLFLLLIQKNFWLTISTGLLTILFWYLFTLPYSLNFIPMAEGLKLVDARSAFYQLLVLYGGFWLISIPFVVYFIKTSLRSRFAVIARSLRRSNLISNSDFFVLALLLAATILVIIPELIYVKDIYINDHRRANTMFKLVYQAFIMYSLSGGYILIRLRKIFVYRLLFLLVLIAHLIYPYFAIKSYRDSHSEFKYWGLRGTDYLQEQFPDNLAVINWINTNITGQPHLVEAVGDSYTKFNQVSSATGLPTVVGWLVHEWLWRGGYDGPGSRATEVSVIYESTDSTKVRDLLQKYSVEYILVGSQEREKYPNLSEKKFASFSRVVFQSNNTRLYEIN